MITQIQNYNESFAQKCNKAIHQIEKMYGSRLNDYLEQEKWHYSDIEYIRDAISEIETNILQRIDSVQEDIEYLGNDCSDIKNKIDESHEQFQGVE